MCMQYTIRNVSDALDARLRERASDERTSLNDVVLRLLTQALGLSIETTRHRDLSDIAGSWQHDPSFARAVADQDSIDPDLWK